jgi:hypothetical protein
MQTPSEKKSRTLHLGCGPKIGFTYLAGQANSLMRIASRSVPNLKTIKELTKLGLAV